MPGASHTACTIETVPLNLQVDVAVIDEVQMLGDDARGWAWTRALQVSSPRLSLSALPMKFRLWLERSLAQYWTRTWTDRPFDEAVTAQDVWSVSGGTDAEHCSVRLHTQCRTAGSTVQCAKCRLCNKGLYSSHVP